MLLHISLGDRQPDRPDPPRSPAVSSSAGTPAAPLADMWEDNRGHWRYLPLGERAELPYSPAVFRWSSQVV